MAGMPILSRGKRMLKASLQRTNVQEPRAIRKKRSPVEEAKWWCDVGLDQDGFQLKYMGDYKDVKLDWDYLHEVAASRAGAYPRPEPSPVPRFVEFGLRTLFRPPCLVWNPLVQFKMALQCPFHSCEQLCFDGDWNCDRNRPPIKLYDVTGPMYLIAARYHCRVQCDGENQPHTLIATDHGILAQCQLVGGVPFHLSHRSAATERLSSYITHRIMTGTKFEQLAHFLAEEVRWFLEGDNVYTMNDCFVQVRLPVLAATLGQQWPSKSYVQDVFLHAYTSNSGMYKEYMHSLTGKVLSMDHTFKVSANIGYHQTSDNRFVRLFDSMFMVMNESGLVLSWKLTKSQSFDAVRDILTEVHGRSGMSVALKLVVDNCCAWRSKLQDVFGPVVVHLDIFHAMQRVTRVLKHRHPLNRELLKALRSVFRSHGDTDIKRTQATPPRDVMEANLRRVIAEWRSVNSDGVIYFTPDLDHQCAALLLHIQKGCLSDIPAGMGTNRNERLHRDLNNSAIAVGSMGPQLATALLDVIVYRHNIRNDRHHTGPVMPVHALTDPVNDNGLDIVADISSEQHGNVCTAVAATMGSVSDLDGVCDRVHTLTHRTLDVWPFFASMFPQYFNWFCYAMSCDTLSLLHTVFGDGTAYDETLSVCRRSGLQVSTRPDSSLSTYMRANNGPCDMSLGNGCFRVQCGEGEDLRQGLARLAEQLQCVLLACGGNANAPALAFLPESGVWDGVCLCFVYGVDCVEGHWMIGELDECADEESVDLEGKNSATDEAGMVNGRVKGVGCRCGQSSGKSSSRTYCVPSEKYKARCPCLKGGDGCGSTCRCRRCDNPRGKQQQFTTSKQRRPQLRTPRPKSEKVCGREFIETRTGEAAPTTWSKLETIALWHLHEKGIASKRIKKLTPKEVCHSFHRLHRVCVGEKCACHIAPKADRQIVAKYVHIMTTSAALRDMCQSLSLG